MRVFGHSVTVMALACVAAIAAQTPASPPDKETAAILAAAREALGGDAKLAAIKSFVATGRTRQIRGNNLVPIEFEIACELPDKYVRKDEIPAQESDPTSSGFNGDLLVQIPPPPPPRAGGPGPGRGEPPAGAARGEPPAGARAGTPPATPPAGATPPPAAAPPAGATPPAGAEAGRAAGPGPGGPGRAGGPPIDPRRARVNTVKQDFVKLTLGMFATSFSSYPLTFTRAGQAEAPQGKADVIDIKGPEGSNFTARLFINTQSHQPIMVSWQAAPTNVIVTAPGQPAPKPETLAAGTVVVEGPAAPAAGASKEEADKYTKEVADVRRKAQAKLLEHRLYYADYRDAGNGVLFPFRLRRAIGPDTVEETNFDSFRFNQKIDPRKFEPVK
jgi:hypothetical protein